MARGKRTDLTGEKAVIVDNDPRDSLSSVEANTKPKDDELMKLCGWVTGRVRSWTDHRRANYDTRWDEYERLWRGIWSGQEKQRKSERSKIITPALSEAVENAISEVEEAIFGRGDFFDIKAEVRDPAELKAITDKNKATLKEDMAKTGFVLNVSDALINSAVYGTGIAEIVVEDVEEKEIVPVADGEGGFTASVKEETVTYATLRSVNPRNFSIDPVARTINDGLGCAIEENVGSHIIKAGQESGEYRKVPLEGVPEDNQTSADPQMITPYTADTIPVIRYYGKVPEHMLFPPEKTEKLVEGDDPMSEEPSRTKMIEAIVIIAHGNIVLKAEENPHLMRDRSVIAFQWDSIPGRFWGRGVCEKGATPQKLLDAEFRSRMDALAYAAAPMMGIDATRLPRGFKLDVYPGKSVLTNGDPSTILKPFKFGEVDQNTYQQAQALDQMVQRATGAVDGISMAQNGASGDARSGAVSMSMAGIVKRSKRTLMRFVDSFMQPALRKLMWRSMQYAPKRYIPVNFSFVVTSTMGIMQREYETQQLTALLQSMEPGSEEYLTLMIGVLGNTGLPNRAELIDMLKAKIETMKQAAAQPPVDPAAMQPQGLDPTQQTLNQAKAMESQARAGLIQAQTQNELIEPQFKAREISLKGIYNTPEEQASAEFDRRMKMADLMLKEKDISSNENIARGQIQGSIAKAQIDAQAKTIQARNAQVL